MNDNDLPLWFVIPGVILCAVPPLAILWVIIAVIISEIFNI